MKKIDIAVSEIYRLVAKEKYRKALVFLCIFYKEVDTLLQKEDK